MSEAYDRRRTEQIAYLQQKVLGPLTERLRWDRVQLDAHRSASLRAIVAHARARSAWHRDRLRHIDLSELTEAGLGALPVMTKEDLMASWDEIVTDPALDLKLCEAHLEATGATPEYLLDQYHVIASGGSSGTRGLFVYDWEEWSTFYAATLRGVMHAFQVNELAPGTLRGASVAGRAPTHATVALGMTFGAGTDAERRSSFPVWLPLEEIVAGLNESQPTMLTVYTSMVEILAAEARAGRLRIQPRWFMTTSEPLLPEIVRLIEETWQGKILNQYGTSDVGMMGSGCGLGGVHLNEDLLIVEPVDGEGNPVPIGETAAKLYVTSLYQRTLPMIRYELTDEVGFIDGPCPCGWTFRRMTDPQGRQDDLFCYAGCVVHPHLFRSPLSRRREVVEYQIRQTSNGAEIDLVVTGEFDLRGLEQDLLSALATAGVVAPEVELRRVEAIPRIGIGKLKRFVPLPR